MTASRDETENLQNKSATHSIATGFAAVREAVAAASRVNSLAGGEPTAANSMVLADSGAAVETRHQAARVLEGTANPPIARGDVRVIEPLPWLEGRRRLAIVRRVDADRDVAEVMLAHPWPELATDTDAVIADDNSGLPFPLVVECYLRSPVWLLQVRQRVGALKERLLAAVGHAVVDGDPAAEGVLTGLPLAGPADPRWRFKENESAELRVLARDCVTALLDTGHPWPVEPERLHPSTYGAAEAGPDPTAASLEATVHFLATRSVAVDFRSLDPATLVPERWIEHLGRDVGMSVFAALRPALDMALSCWSTDRLWEAA